MLSKVLSSATIGVEAFPVDVEVDLSMGLPYFSTVGLPDNAVKESKDRVRAAIKNSGYLFPAKRITVNLAPADVKKEGTTFDLPVAIGILVAEGQIKNDSVQDYLVVGELSLDGSIKGVRGALSAAVCARSLNKKMIVAKDNVEEAGIVDNVEVYGVANLAELVEFLNGNLALEPLKSANALLKGQSYFASVDISEVRGQAHVKRALEVAAAGGHNLLMIGPPGSGKTMLARRFSTILPDMTLDEAIETTKVHSVAGLLSGQPLVTERPFRAPHHTISDAGLIGGGRVPRPGEVSLAHNGVLFLDEMPEFRKNVLEVLRQPMEEGRVLISRAAVSIAYPAAFMLIGAMNPCPCGYLGDPKKECRCTPVQIAQYRAKLSGPLMDRIDIHCDVPSISFADMSGEPVKSEGSKSIKKRVDTARALQKERFCADNVYCNSRMPQRLIKRYCAPMPEAARQLERAVEVLGLSARAYTRVLKVARTIADLEGADKISTAHVSEALQYRTLDRMAV